MWGVARNTEIRLSAEIWVVDQVVRCAPKRRLVGGCLTSQLATLSVFDALHAAGAAFRVNGQTDCVHCQDQLNHGYGHVHGDLHH